MTRNESDVCEIETDIMGVRNAYELTVAELKQKLRELGLSCSGNKAELVTRLNETDPSGVWSGELPENEGATGVTVNEETLSAMEEQLNRHVRDKRVLEEELNVLRQEIESLRVQSWSTSRVTNVRAEAESRPVQQPKISISAIAELLATFDGTTGNFEAWERQLRMLKRTYKLDDEHAKIIIGMRLKGKALEWLHSKPEFVEISVEALLCELKTMFDHRPSRIVLRKKFEERVWKKGETFSDYVHQKGPWKGPWKSYTGRRGRNC